LGFTGRQQAVNQQCWNRRFPKIAKECASNAARLPALATSISGLALLVLGVLYWWIDIHGHRRGTLPFVAYGTNALIVFAVSGQLARTLNAIHTTDSAGNAVNIKDWLWVSVFERAFDSPYNASLAHAIVYVLLLLGFAWLLYSRKIFIKV
jgi:predicted acyltransferase